jgi:hypothetical protein
MKRKSTAISFAILVSIAAIMQIAPGQFERRTGDPENMDTFVRSGKKWRSLADYRRESTEFVNSSGASPDWQALKSATLWIDPSATTNFMTMDYIFGLGKTSILVYISRDGKITGSIRGRAVDRSH